MKPGDADITSRDTEKHSGDRSTHSKWSDPESPNAYGDVHYQYAGADEP